MEPDLLFIFVFLKISVKGTVSEISRWQCPIYNCSLENFYQISSVEDVVILLGLKVLHSDNF